LIAGELKLGENPAMATGKVGISVAYSTDVVKVHLQSQRAADHSAPKLYNGSIDCYHKSYPAAGLAGFWVGIIPNILRSSVINAAELESYD
jgi:hypothetical protein